MKSGNEIAFGVYRGLPVGKGGFATVYRVTNPQNQPFALKLADSDADEATRQSLYHEFTIQSQLIHPQVVHAHEFGLHDERPYIVLDWINGVPLFNSRKPSSPEDFVVMLRQIARVLHFIHHRGWVHGDLKPDNFLWRDKATGDAEPSSTSLSLLDFGLARRIGDADRPRGAGTVGYCAPEFLNSKPADGRADWYSVGIILYEWVFGVRPYASDEPALEIAGHLEGEPDFTARRLRPAPEWADSVISRLLSKTPEDRADDEIALLSWMAEFESEFEPTSLLNQQLTWHIQSESSQLRSGEQGLLEILSEELVTGQAAIWSVDTHGSTSDAFLRRAAGQCSSVGYSTCVETYPGQLSILSDTRSLDAIDPRLRVRWHDSQVFAGAALGPEPLRSLSLCPWDRHEVAAYIQGVVGDEDVAQAWTDTIHRATCGLPAAVHELVTQLIAEGHLSVNADGWGLDIEQVEAWANGRAQHHVTAVLGELNPPERELCEWLSLGEGRGALSVLRQLWSDVQIDLDGVLAVLASRGYVVRQRELHSNEFDLRLRLVGHAGIVRSAMSQTQIGKRSEALATAIDDAGIKPAAIRAEVLAHAYARAGVWDKSSSECLRTASFAIKADERERAMHYIIMAQQSAGRIDDVKLRSHWMGHARMVEGDVQKASGQLEIARQIYRELLGLCRQTGDRRLLAETLHDLGDLYRIMRRHDKGIRVERRALQIWESLGERAELSRSLNSLGNLHRLACELSRAREFYQQALQIQRDLGLEQFAAVNLNNIGLICWQENNFTDAERYLGEALTIHERLDVPVEIARVLNNLGAISFVQGHLDESAGHFRRAATLNASVGAESESLYNQRNLVEVALEEGNLRTVVELGEQVYQASRQLGDISTMAEVGAVLADAYFRAGDYRSFRRMHAEVMASALTVKNDELRAYLELQRAAYVHRFRSADEALNLVDSTMTVDRQLTRGYQFVDAIILKMQIAALLHDDESLTRLYARAVQEAEAIGAPHKRAQLAQVRLLGSCDEASRNQLTQIVEQFLEIRPRWHWARTFRMWQSREFAKAQRFDKALETIASVTDDLRQDGCWELLWRALVVQGAVCHAQADYEPAIRALEEAESMLKIVSSMVEDDKERSFYLECDDARALVTIKEKIVELV